MSKTLRSPEQQLLQQLLIAARKAAGLTQQALADRLERQQSFVAKYEGGERRLDVIEFCQVAEALGADPMALLRKVVRHHARTHI